AAFILRTSLVAYSGAFIIAQRLNCDWYSVSVQPVPPPSPEGPFLPYKPATSISGSFQQPGPAYSCRSAFTSRMSIIPCPQDSLGRRFHLSRTSPVVLHK